MNKRYLITGSWIDKTTGKPVSGMAEITKGKNKQGQAYEIANTDNRETIEGTYPVGMILNATISITTDNAPPADKAPLPAPQQKSTKA